MNTLSRIAASHPTAPPPKVNDPSSPALKPHTKHQPMNIPPALSTSALAVPGNADNQNLGHSEQQLKRQGLESMVAVLRSLVTWGTASGKAEGSTTGEVPPESGVTAVSSIKGSNTDGMMSDASLDKLSAPANGTELSRTPTPEAADDPSRFESAKQKKTSLLEGIRQFNFKPRRVRCSSFPCPPPPTEIFS